MGIQRQVRKNEMIKNQSVSNNIEVQKLATYKVLLGEAVDSLKVLGQTLDVLKYNVFLSTKCGIFNTLLKYNDGNIEKSMEESQSIIEKFITVDNTPPQLPVDNTKTEDAEQTAETEEK